MLQTMHQKGQKGFTLVELMIVVAIIGILAAIAIPQFAQYRIRGFNSSAMSDIRNLNTSQAAFYTDWNQYAYTISDTAEVGTDRAGDSKVAAGANNPAGVLWSGEMDALKTTLIGAFIRDGIRSQAIVLGSNVQIVAHTSDNDDAGPGVTFVAAAKHYQGDAVYAIDADSPAMYRDDETLDPGQSLVPTMIPVSAAMDTADNLVNLGNFVAL